MSVFDATVQSMQDILGLEEMTSELDLNLWETGLIDSLGLVAVIIRIEELLKTGIRIEEMQAEDFTTIRKMVSAISAQLGES